MPEPGARSAPRSSRRATIADGADAAGRLRAQQPGAGLRLARPGVGGAHRGRSLAAGTRAAGNPPEAAPDLLAAQTGIPTPELVVRTRHSRTAGPAANRLFVQGDYRRRLRRRPSVGARAAGRSAGPVLHAPAPGAVVKPGAFSTPCSTISPPPRPRRSPPAVFHTAVLRTAPGFENSGGRPDIATAIDRW